MIKELPSFTAFIWIYSQKYCRIAECCFDTDHMIIVSPFVIIKLGRNLNHDCLNYCLQWNGNYNSQVSKLKPILSILIFNSLEIFNAISRTWVWLIPSVLLWRASPMEPYMGIQWFWMILIQTSCYIKSLKTSNYHIQVLIAMVSAFHELIII